MGPSRFLPEKVQLDALLAQAGVVANGKRPSPAELEGGGDRVRFMEALAPRRSASSRPTSVPPLPPLVGTVDEALEVFGEAHGTMEQRLERLVQWLIGSTGAFAAFVADTEGLPLVNRNAPESYVAAVGPLSRAQENVGRFAPTPAAGSHAIEIDEHNVLQVVWVDTTAGRLAIGLVLADPLDRSIVPRVRRVAQISVRGPGGN